MLRLVDGASVSLSLSVSVSLSLSDLGALRVLGGSNLFFVPLLLLVHRTGNGSPFSPTYTREIFFPSRFET
jgi:hypothetical protein